VKFGTDFDFTVKTSPMFDVLNVTLAAYSAKARAYMQNLQQYQDDANAISEKIEIINFVNQVRVHCMKRLKR
jgi:hypothetical protein